MNSVVLIGRLTKEPDIRYINDVKLSKFTLAVDRKFKKGETDFINCTAFGKTVEIIERYCDKGKKIGVIGRIQTGSYTNKDGKKVYTTDVIVESIELLDSRKTEEPKEAEILPGPMGNDEFMDIPDGIENDIPFK